MGKKHCMRRISLSNSAFEGDNNVYLFTQGSETVMIDTGDRMKSTRDQLAAKLADHGVGFADIDRVFLTHWHGDHTGQAGAIREQSGAEILIHERDAPLLEGDQAAWSDMETLRESYLEEWGVPPEKKRALLDLMPGSEMVGKSTPVSTFDDGDVFSFNGIELEVVHTPGHADGLCMFELNREGVTELFSGDTLLPVYTPNVGGADVRVNAPLQNYLRALRGIAETDYVRAWPGHRGTIDDPAQRAEHIIQHHKDRAWRVLDTLRRRGSCDTWTISTELFGTLEGIHILHGPGEAYAHLNHLAQENIISKDGNEYSLEETVRGIERKYDGSYPLVY